MARSRFCCLVLFSLFLGSAVANAQPGGSDTFLDGRAVWANPESDAFNDSSTAALVDHCKRANINLIVLLVEYSDQHVYYQSTKFSESILPLFRNFDPLAAVIREAHKQGIRVHAWLCDFTQSGNGPIMKNHPEWAQRNPEGKISTEAELLDGGVVYDQNWMCPARRPGYTDQWLIPMIEEIVTNYDVDGIHHDYVRYPGDVAPDGYCFCDYCVEEMMTYAHLYYEAYPDSVFPVIPRLPRPEANWSTDITVRPKEWAQWDRKKKAEFLMTGSFLPGGPKDLNYFFYTYRQDAINRFAREAWEHASAIKPNIEVSAAVFKNPIMSGRFIGQRWTDFAPWVDLLMPMVYRSHFPAVNYDTFITMLEEYTRYEYAWAKDRGHLSIGLDVVYMYNEEQHFITDALHLVDSLTTLRGVDRDRYVRRVQLRYAEVKDNLQRVAPELERKLTPALSDLSHLTPEQLVSAQETIVSLNANPPEGYYPKEKLRRALEAVRKGGGNGVVIFGAGPLTFKKLWPVLEDVFEKPSIEPYAVSSAAQMSVVQLRALREENASAQRRFWYLLLVAILLFFTLLVVAMRKRRVTS